MGGALNLFWPEYNVCIERIGNSFHDVPGMRLQEYACMTQRICRQGACTLCGSCVSGHRAQALVVAPVWRPLRQGASKPRWCTTAGRAAARQAQREKHAEAHAEAGTMHSLFSFPSIRGSNMSAAGYVGACSRHASTEALVIL